jgi:hypothetical protein
MGRSVPASSPKTPTRLRATADPRGGVAELSRRKVTIPLPECYCAQVAPTMTWWEYLRKEATDVPNLMLVAMLALIISAVLWFSPAIERGSEWYRTYIASDDAPSLKTLSDAIRSRNR